ncbi:hypothetical protein [uncultured Sanguibacteroides sp.]|uniref:hypothetical protein n=1 Tax=uncultured Sanguibacteroides sp. TaxID=1635151 RepID=UPI0025F57088|nr:hypothetical protein [uncultured Sanguibacteroides sp.]
MENPFESSKPKRSTFLLVLCILTFIGSGWGILSNLIGLFTAELQNSTVEMQQLYQSAGSSDSGFLKAWMNSSMDLMQVTDMHATAINLSGLFLSLFSLIGAIFMFNLKRVGFYIYTAAQILALFVLPYYAGFSMLVWVSFVTSGFFTLLFIILYAVNYKQLK